MNYYTALFLSISVTFWKPGYNPAQADARLVIENRSVIITKQHIETLACYARYSDLVYLTVTLLFEGKSVQDLSGRCAGNKPILDFIKPQIQRMFGYETLNRKRRLVIGMHCRGDRDWSSPACQFKVSSSQRFLSDFVVVFI